MRSNAGAPLSRRRFLALSAGGAAAGAAALSGCALQVSSGVGGSGESITTMVNDGDIAPALLKQAQKELGIGISLIKNDVTRLTAILASGQPPDLVRGIGALDTPYFAAREVAENLDPYFAKSTVLKADDLDPVNDLWRYDGKVQGKGPRYGMAKDFSQDSMYWYNTAHFDEAGVDYPSDTEPVTYEEWLDMARRLTQRKNGQTKVYGGSANGLAIFINLMSLTAAAGGRLFTDDLSPVDFGSPEARKALTWYVDYAKARVGPSLIDPDPNGWDGPTYEAGRMAMSNSGYWLGGMINAVPKLAKVSRLAPAPVFEGALRVSSCQGATGLWMPKKAAHKDAAWRVFEWFFGEGPAKDREGRLGHPHAEVPAPSDAESGGLPAAGAEGAERRTGALLGDLLHPLCQVRHPRRRDEPDHAFGDEGPDLPGPAGEAAQQSTDRTSLAVAVSNAYVTSAGTPLNNLVATGAVMYVVPILLIFLVAQRGFVAGMSTTGLK